MELNADRYAGDSWLSAFDPRVKLLCFLSLAVVIAFLTGMDALLLALAFVLTLAASSRIPPLHLARGYAMAFPFIFVASLTMLFTSGAENALAMGTRISASVLLLLVLVSSTPFMDVLWALRWFRMPSVLSDMIMFTYRFIFVMLDESGRMRLARASRGFQGGRSLLDKEAFKVLSNTLGMMFLRSYRRADRVYMALLSRGYDGKVRALSAFRVRLRDAGLGLAFVIIGGFSLSQQMGWHVWW
ncbi:MAG TPA: cobalt ECF transporter T component CbiQ [Methanomassiliicoccales archaeon]|nr:cobalt ECF transporter T component CbiQ [Methanomassiliicoccales archaeon]